MQHGKAAAAFPPTRKRSLTKSWQSATSQRPPKSSTRRGTSRRNCISALIGTMQKPPRSGVCSRRGTSFVTWLLRRRAIHPRPEVRVFFKTDADSGYKPTVMIMQDKDEYRKLLDRALAELNSFRAKYKTLVELDGVFDAIDKVAG